MREADISQTSISAWERRVSDARDRLTGEIPAVQAADSPLERESHSLLEELAQAFEELQVAEEELHVQTEALVSSRELLEAERLRYRELFEHAPVAYVVTDQHGLITDLNRAAATLMGVAQHRLRGKPLAVFVTPARRRAFRDQLAAFGPNPLEVGLHLRLRPRGGEVRSFSAAVGVVRYADKIRELRWLLVDETERRRRERRVRSMNEELKHRVAERTAELERALERQAELTRAAEAARHVAERASREKSELIAIVSHELRTPLAAIGGYAELLTLDIRGPLTGPQRSDVQRIHEAQAHILGLVEDLVGYSKLGSGRLRFDISDVIVGDVTEAVVSLVRPQAEAKAITVTVVPSELQAVALADVERLRQIIINLLSNAIKFTPRGGNIWISDTADERSVRIHVRDDGIGILAENLESVFEPYVQLGSGTTQERGWGLGLPISRDLARAMNGDLFATGGTGQGTVFTVQLPRSARMNERTRG
jgi:PAS domain S-box-containing protein